MTAYFPMFVDLQGKPCLLVGAGKVATGKAAQLLDAGAEVTVVAPEASPQIIAWRDERRLVWRRRVFLDADLYDRFLVVAATDNGEVNAHIHRLAEAKRMLVNVVDVPVHCNFILGAVVDAGPVRVVVSSAGTSPTLAGRIRDRIRDEILGPEVGDLATFLGDWRTRANEKLSDYNHKKRFWGEVLDSEIPNLIAQLETDRADTLMAVLLEQASELTNRAAAAVTA